MMAAWVDRITKRLDGPEEIGWIAPTNNGNPQILVGPIGQGPFPAHHKCYLSLSFLGTSDPKFTLVNVGA
ncbi:hypothetical protein PISMIDRAFT_684463 [Pisolithus microcarpus 441]|uniref:Uncharacterized protein n=1 Tax=Pisolithus microcarpus 441 TaxID=765257 RepID=A0A0C9Z6W3_9AGAM|nr:hypothetical protein PISMIDRAFT_684463 [Pisolithus microcarpus 441]